jgi:PKD repeat protein
VASYAWDFGDGTTGTWARPQHTYAGAGDEPVTLTVTDDQGATGSVTHTVTVGAPAPPSGDGPCGLLTYDPAHPPTYSHVVVIMDENKQPKDLTPSTAPYLTGLKSECGYEGFMHAATHASDPNYMAATSGFPTPLGSMIANDNVFHQAQVAGDSWRSYQQSMTRNCGPGHQPYSTWHDPAHWYSDLRSPVNTCATNDVPLSPSLANDLANDALRAYSWITPDDCHNMHWDSTCSYPQSQAVYQGDQWLSQVVSQITSTSDYLAGRTLVVITWDEGSGPATKGVDCTSPAVYSKQASCQIPTFVLSPYITPGRVDNSDHNLCSLLGTTEDILGYPRLGRAVGQTSMRPGLGF